MTPFQKLIRYLKGTRTVQNQVTMGDVKSPNEQPSREEYRQLEQKLEDMSNQKTELETKLAQVKQQEGQQKQREEDVSQEEQIKQDLNEQEQQIEQEEKPNYFSLRRFFNSLNRNKKLRDNLYFTDFQRSKKMERFGDIGIAPDGNLVLVNDKGEIVMNIPDISTALQSPAALPNDVETYKIPLNVRENGQYKENIDNWEVPEFTPTLDGKYKWAKAKKKYYYEYLTELMTKIKKQTQEIENLEMTNTQLQNENDRLKSELRVREIDSQTSRAEIGHAEREMQEMRKSWRDMKRELSQARDSNIVLEDDVKRVESELEKMRGKAEREDSKTSDEKQFEHIMDVKSKLVKDQPRQIIEKQPESPPNPTPPPQNAGGQ